MRAGVGMIVLWSLCVGEYTSEPLAQATVSDRAVGSLMLLAAALVFSYYTIWVLVLVSGRLVP